LIWESILSWTLLRAEGRLTEAMERNFEKSQDAWLKQLKERKANELAQPPAVDPGAAQDEGLSVEDAAAAEFRKKAKKLGVRPARLERWDKLIKFKEQDMTQGLMARRVNKSERTIAQDFQDMKKMGYYPK
jgi:hypothetical protein